MYSTVYSTKAGWVVGKSQDHGRRQPLEWYEVGGVCAMLNSLPKMRQKLSRCADLLLKAQQAIIKLTRENQVGYMEVVSAIGEALKEQEDKMRSL